MDRILPIALFIACSGAAHAMPIYSYSTDNPSNDLLRTNPGGGVNLRVGEILSLDTSFDVGNQIFTWGYKVRSGANAVIANGFWVVVSDGPNPKDNVDEYAILYGDLVAGQITEYVYSWHNRRNSFDTSKIFFDSFENAITSTEFSGVTSVLMSTNPSIFNRYNVSNIRFNSRPNSANVDAVNWHGVSFGNAIGFWFHPTENSTFRYSRTDGSLSRLNPGITSWHGTNGALTTAVPEPTSLALLSIGVLAGFAVFRRRREDTAVVANRGLSRSPDTPSGTLTGAT